MLKDKNKRIWQVLKLVFLIGMLIVFFFYVPIHQIYAAVRSVDPQLFWISFFVSYPVLYLSAVSLWLFTRKQGINLKIYQIFTINLVVRFYSFFLPASIVGSGLRWYKIASKGNEVEALSAVAVSRVWDIFLAILFGVIWAVTGLNSKIIHPGLYISLIFLIVWGWFTVLRLSPKLSIWAQIKSLDEQRNLFRKIFVLIEKLFSAFSSSKKLSWSELSTLFGASIIKELLSLFGYTLLARALQIPISFIDLGWMRAIFFLSALAPFTFIGGIGLREVSVVYIMSTFGINTELATAYSFLLYTRSVILYLSGGLVELFLSLFGRKVD